MDHFEVFEMELGRAVQAFLLTNIQLPFLWCIEMIAQGSEGNL